VDVDRSKGGDIQHLSFQNVPIGHYNRDIGLERCDFGEEVVPTRTIRREDRNALLNRDLLDRGRLQSATTPGWPVRLSDNTDDLVAFFVQGAQ
jgi:hypothetical protein